MLQFYWVFLCNKQHLVRSGCTGSSKWPLHSFSALRSNLNGIFLLGSEHQKKIPPTLDIFLALYISDKDGVGAKVYFSAYQFGANWYKVVFQELHLDYYMKTNIDIHLHKSGFKNAQFYVCNDKISKDNPFSVQFSVQQCSKLHSILLNVLTKPPDVFLCYYMSTTQDQILFFWS